MIYVSKITSYKFKNQAKDILPIVCIAGLSGFVARKFIMIFNLSGMTNFILGSIAVVIIYLILGLVFFINKEMVLEIKSKIKFN